MVSRMSERSLHLCPLCTIRHIPVWRSMCGACFNIVPWKLRADLMHAYRDRVMQQAHYQEVLALTKQWWNEHRPPMEEDED